jgi:hypothetical protein
VIKSKRDSLSSKVRVPEMCGLVCIMSTQAGYSGFVVASHCASNQPASRSECTLNHVLFSKAGQWPNVLGSVSLFEVPPT